MFGDTHDPSQLLSRLDASRLLLQPERQSSELHGLLILLELPVDGRQGTLLGSPAVCLFLAACKVEVDADYHAVARGASFVTVLVIVPTLVAWPMSAHDHPRLSDGEAAGFGAFAHAEDRAQCARHFALLRP